jgi:hypothetical protein
LLRNEKGKQWKVETHEGHKSLQLTCTGMTACLLEATYEFGGPAGSKNGEMFSQMALAFRPQFSGPSCIPIEKVRYMTLK